MTFFYYISDFIIPLTIFYIIAYGLTEKVHVYDEFVTGAADGIRTVGKILPTLVGLMAAVGMLRASGFLDFVAEYLTGVAKLLHFPVQILRDGLLHRTDCVHHDGMYGDNLLHHERLFPDCKSHKDPVDPCGSACEHFRRDCRQRGACRNDVTFLYMLLLSKYGNRSRASRISWKSSRGASSR